MAVGGTTLTVSSAGSYVSETGWSDGGGGISTYETEPTYQTLTGITDKSGNRVAPDVAYDADPNSGLMVYDSVTSGGTSGWQIVGGTSAGAPQWSAIIAIANQARVANGLGTLSSTPAYIYAIYSKSPGDFHDVTSGNNGYAAGTGYDAVTGLGSPVASSIVRDLATITSSTFTKSSTTITIAPSNGSGGGNGGGGGGHHGGRSRWGSGPGWGGGPGWGEALSSGPITTSAQSTPNAVFAPVETSSGSSPVAWPTPSAAAGSVAAGLPVQVAVPADSSRTESSQTDSRQFAAQSTGYVSVITSIDASVVGTLPARTVSQAADGSPAVDSRGADLVFAALGSARTGELDRVVGPGAAGSKRRRR